ncbi:MAG TPA: YkgJ family cysteine cluster protein [Candidatus Gastranaerophilales bacterium]|nr:YkgJ family cysteine cluster protein [Candidatus Gastranaerophilales bacterium]
MQKYIEKLKKFFLLRILRRKYARSGSCKGCGRCCREIYVKNARGLIREENEFKRLKKIHPFYSYLKIREKTETGLVFECAKLDKETNRCTVYNIRSFICKLYPQEEIFKIGGAISEECGYKFIPLENFEEVLNKIKKRRNR